MADNINHAANLVHLISVRDDEVRELTKNYNEVYGEKVDLDAELTLSLAENKKLRLQARSTERQHKKEVDLLSERIREVTAFCNEETRAKASLKAELESVKQDSKAPDALPLVLQQILVAGVAHYHAIVMQCALAAVNRATNKVGRELCEVYGNDFSGKRPSLHRTAVRLCKHIGSDVPSASDLSKNMPEYVAQNIDFYMKDAQYSMSEWALTQILTARRTHSHYGAYGATAVRTFQWLPALSASLDDVEDDYNEVVEQSLYKICQKLIDSNFS